MPLEIPDGCVGAALEEQLFELGIPAFAPLHPIPSAICLCPLCHLHRSRMCPRTECAGLSSKGNLPCTSWCCFWHCVWKCLKPPVMKFARKQKFLGKGKWGLNSLPLLQTQGWPLWYLINVTDGNLPYLGKLLWVANYCTLLLPCCSAEIYCVFFDCIIRTRFYLDNARSPFKGRFGVWAFCYRLLQAALCLGGAEIAVCHLGNLSSEVRWPQSAGHLKQIV